MRVDILVIGAGPAGLTAARAAAEAGASVLVVDQAGTPGGHLASRVDTLQDPPHLAGLRADTAARKLAEAAQAVGATIQTGSLCWALFDDCAAVMLEGKMTAVQATSIVVATGSLPAPLPFRGWTLPGVMTAPAVESVINRMAYLPGKQAVVVGDTPEAERVAWLLELCGASVLRTVHIDGASGREHLSAVTIQGENHPADLVVLAAGRVPQVELLNAAGCPLTGSGSPVHDHATQATPLLGVLVAGSASGVGTLSHSILTGALAGITAAEQSGVLPPADAAARRAELLQQLGARSELIVPAPEGPLPTDEFALVCRCEEVPRTEVEDAIRAGARTVDDVKRMTRCGMGFCQGKSCTLTVMRLLALSGATPAPQPLRLRAPVRPVRLGDLAAAGRDVSLLERAIHQEGSEPTS